MYGAGGGTLREGEGNLVGKVLEFGRRGFVIRKRYSEGDFVHNPRGEERPEGR